MAKFKVNDSVIVVATGQRGTVVCREEENDKEARRTKVTYLVKLGAGFENYKVFSRNELTKVVPTITEMPSYVRVYDAPNGFKVTCVAFVKTNCLGWDFDVKDSKFHQEKERNLRIGFSFYNPDDEYVPELGFKIARHRAETRPFCNLKAKFLGEFPADTVYALMDAKAKYVVEHLDTFVSN